MPIARSRRRRRHQASLALAVAGLAMLSTSGWTMASLAAASPPQATPLRLIWAKPREEMIQLWAVTTLLAAAATTATWLAAPAGRRGPMLGGIALAWGLWLYAMHQLGPAPMRVAWVIQWALTR